jgi:hypothetical protein
MRDCLVVNVREPAGAALTHRMSGGDCDGDQIFVTWESEIVDRVAGRGADVDVAGLYTFTPTA